MNFVNADMISAGLSPLKPESVAIEASRVFLSRLRELIARRVNFAFETTLAGQAYTGLLQRMRDKGYRIHLLFLWVPSPELALRRVADRVRKGGHNVPEKDVRRRFSRGLRNLFSVYKDLCDVIAIFDNSSAHPRLITVLGSRADIVLDVVAYERICQQGAA